MKNFEGFKKKFGDDDNFDIIITELVPNPEDSDAENEFIEIYNRENKEINIVLYGKNLSEDEQNKWKQKLVDFGLEGTTLIMRQGADNSDLRAEVENLTDLYAQNQKIIS